MRDSLQKLIDFSVGGFAPDPPFPIAPKPVPAARLLSFARQKTRVRAAGYGKGVFTKGRLTPNLSHICKKRRRKAAVVFILQISREIKTDISPFSFPLRLTGLYLPGQNLTDFHHVGNGKFPVPVQVAPGQLVGSGNLARRLPGQHLTGFHHVLDGHLPIPVQVAWQDISAGDQTVDSV